MTDYFKGRRMEILTSDSTSYIKAEFGSWVSTSLDNSKGKVEINLIKSNGASYANLNFDFSLEYLAALTVTIIGILITYIVYTMLEIPSLFTLFIILLIVIFVWGIIGLSVSLTRRRFMEEFNMFIQSLSTKKQ